MLALLFFIGWIFPFNQSETKSTYSVNEKNFTSKYFRGLGHEGVKTYETFFSFGLIEYYIFGTQQIMHFIYLATTLDSTR